MTNKNAAIIIAGTILTNTVDKYELEALNLVLEALEKQIPKKPYKNYNGEIHKDRCPMCHRSLFPNEHHCKCGQALDWSDKE